MKKQKQQKRKNQEQSEKQSESIKRETVPGKHGTIHMVMDSGPKHQDFRGKEYYLAGDPAKQHDYFGIALLQRVNKTIKLIGLKELQLDYTVVANYMALLYKRWNVLTVFLDETGVGNVFMDMLNAKGLAVEGETLSNPKKVEIVETVIRLIQEGRVKLPKEGAEELKQQLREQERGLTDSGLIRLKHPPGSHDDLFWAFCIGVYGIKKQMDESSPFIFASNNLDGQATSVSMADEDLFPELDKPGVEITDVATHIPDIPG